MMKMAADPKKGTEKTRYLKGVYVFQFYYSKVITCYGLSHPQNREIFKSFYKEHLQYPTIDFIVCIETIRMTSYDHLDLLSCKKKDSMKSFKESSVWWKQSKHSIQNTFVSWSVQILYELWVAIIDHSIYDWATCDNFSAHVLTKVMLKNPSCIQVS